MMGHKEVTILEELWHSCTFVVYNIESTDTSLDYTTKKEIYNIRWPDISLDHITSQKRLSKFCVFTTKHFIFYSVELIDDFVLWTS